MLRRMNFWFRCYTAFIQLIHRHCSGISLMCVSLIFIWNPVGEHVLTPFAIRRPVCLEHVIRQTQCYMTCDLYVCTIRFELELSFLAQRLVLPGELSCSECFIKKFQRTKNSRNEHFSYRDKLSVPQTDGNWVKRKWTHAELL